MISDNISGVVLFSLEFGFGLVLLILVWPFLLCFCFCKWCNKPYNKNIYITVLATLSVLMVLAISASIYGTNMYT